MFGYLSNPVFVRLSSLILRVFCFLLPYGMTALVTFTVENGLVRLVIFKPGAGVRICEA
jgi:hypothetical protein